MKLNEEMEGSPLTVISVDVGRRPAGMADLLTENNVIHLTLNDPEAVVSHAYGVRGVPTTVVIDDRGRLMYKHVGFGEGYEVRFRTEVETLIEWMDEA